MPTYNVYGSIVGTKYLGQVEAESDAEALKKATSFEAQKKLQAGISLCHECNRDIGNLEIDDITVEEE